MKKVKALVAAAMIVALSASMVSCGGKDTNTTTNNSSSGETKSEGDIDISKEVTITMLVVGDPPANMQNVDNVLAKVNEKLKNQVNAKLQINWVEWADWYTKYNLLLASQDGSIDLVITASDWMDLWQNASKGAFLNITDLLPKYAPQTWAEVPEDHWEQSKFDGEIVTIPEDQYTQWVDHGLYYRGDWAKEFGITEPIKDFETFEKYLQGIKDNKPGVIPWDLASDKYEGITDGWFQSNTDLITIDGTPIQAVSYEDRFTATSRYFDDSFLDMAVMMKRWADNGFWREDVLNYKGDTRALLKEGKTGADQHHTETYLPLAIEMEKKQPGSDLQMFSWGDTRGNLLQMQITHGAMSVAASSKNPERALMVYDLLRNDKEIYQLYNYGIEGVQYVLEDGKRAKPEGYDDTKDGFWTNFWAGRMDKYLIPSVDDNPLKEEVFAEKTANSKPNPYGQFAFDRTAVESEIAAMSDVVNRLLPAIALGKAGDPEKAVAEFRKQYEAAGYEKVKAEVQRQLDEYKKLVGGN